MNLSNQPMYQRAMQRATSKASMQGQRNPNTLGLQTQLADVDLGRKLQFQQLGLQKRGQDLAHAGRMADLGYRKQELKDRKSALPWTIGIGAGTALLGALEGRRRAQLLREDTLARNGLLDIVNKQKEQLKNQKFSLQTSPTDRYNQRYEYNNLPKY